MDKKYKFKYNHKAYYIEYYKGDRLLFCADDLETGATYLLGCYFKGKLSHLKDINADWDIFRNAQRLFKMI